MTSDENQSPSGASSIPHSDFVIRDPYATSDPWSDLLPEASALTPFVLETMLRLIAYDIADPKRLRRVAEVCEDHGVRVQKSLFECWLDEERFEHLWARLEREIKVEEDALAAYVVDRSCVPRRRQAGRAMRLTLPREHFIL